MRALGITFAFMLTTLCISAQTAPQDSTATQAVDVQNVPVGQTFGKRIGELLQIQQQAANELNQMIIVMREQAGLDTTYIFQGITPQGDAVYAKLNKKETP